MNTMNSKILFFRKKMDIPASKGSMAHYYSDLMYVRYVNAYSWLFFVSGTQYKVEAPLSVFLKNLPEQPFFQCNRQEIINK